MNLLAIDTSTEMLSISILYRDRVVFDFNRRKKRSASKLITYLKKALDRLSLKPSNFDALVIGAGPGSFTGLRISFSVIKALAIATGLPVISIGSFESIVFQVKKKFSKVAAIADARRGLVYAATFKVKNGIMKKEKKERLYTLNDFLSKHQKYAFVTYDEHLQKDALNIKNSIEFYPKLIWPRARELAILARDYYKNNKFTPIERLEPLYIYPKECQIRRIQ